MQEEWRIIQDYPNYSVSNLGRVRNDKTGRILKPISFGARGKEYKQVFLFRGSCASRKSFRVHRLVATAFIPNPESKPEVNHLDGNHYNNAVSNLEWTSHTENMIHAFTVLHPDIGKKRCGADNGNSKKVVRIEDGKVFNSLIEAAQACEIKHTSGISACLHGYKRRHKAGGYHWKFYEE